MTITVVVYNYGGGSAYGDENGSGDGDGCCGKGGGSCGNGSNGGDSEGGDNCYGTSVRRSLSEADFRNKGCKQQRYSEPGNLVVDLKFRKHGVEMDATDAVETSAK
ncbi:hypothetical protein RJT34_01182 [Clitoria ternatea]|uniref:Uncharacterized protein n=1 Tax=Clitoria ternatea TaxID=43366 RepID=A0AAN9Q0E9_CLITE